MENVSVYEYAFRKVEFGYINNQINLYLANDSILNLHTSEYKHNCQIKSNISKVRKPT